MLAAPKHGGIRDRFLRATVIFGTILFILTELLSAFHLMRRTPLLVCWSMTGVIALISAARRGRTFRLATPSVPIEPVTLLCSVGVIAILTLTAVTAAFSAPNSADTMAYHLPRVLYWSDESR